VSRNPHRNLGRNFVGKPDISVVSVAERNLINRLPIYLKFMVEQALRNGELSEQNHDVLVLELKTAWGDRHPDLSDRLARVMATLMRHPERQKGRGAKLPTASRRV